ncbi:MAG TPA: choice-of-anchor D domain-containing protein [Kofleriaceae bacterium]|nr:choice-of-anchor D domain-containing protein [Kofleriaceae bacterium]
MRHGWLVLFAITAACSGSPELSTTLQESVIVSPLSKDFGTITVGTTSAVQTISVNPALGNNEDTIDAVTAACPDFVIDAPGLPFTVYRVCDTCVDCVPAAIPCTTTDFQNYQFATAFRPSIAGPQSCVVNISLNGGTTIKTVTLSGTGNPPPIDIDVVPGSVQFGDVRINTQSSPATVSVRNFGGSTLTVSSVTVPAGFNLSGPAAFNVLSGGTQDLTVTCQPGSVGALGGNLSITSNDPQTPTVNVGLACKGVDSNIAIAPSPAVAGTRVGEPIRQPITITNSGGASTTLQSVGLSGAGLAIEAAPAPNTPLGPGGAVQVVVAFDAVAEGEVTGTLSVVTPEGTRTSQITATALLASMSLTPDGFVDFGPVCVGDTDTRTFTVLGNGKGAFQLTSIEPPAAPFTLAAPALPAAIQGSGANQLMFDVSVAPLEPGVAQSTLVLGSDIPNEGPRTVELAVTGLGAGVSATPTEVDLGSEPVDVTTIGQPLTLTNCSETPAAFSNARLEGPNADEFAIVAQPAVTMLGKGESAEWLVVFTSRTVGLKSATFLVDTPDGTVSIALTAEGLGKLTGEAHSYLSCNAGGVGPLGVTLLVLALVLRRRRVKPA